MSFFNFFGVNFDSYFTSILGLRETDTWGKIKIFENLEIDLKTPSLTDSMQKAATVRQANRGLQKFPGQKWRRVPTSHPYGVERGAESAVRRARRGERGA